MLSMLVWVQMYNFGDVNIRETFSYSVHYFGLWTAPTCNTKVRVPFGGLVNTAVLVTISVEHPRQYYAGIKNYFETWRKFVVMKPQDFWQSIQCCLNAMSECNAVLTQQMASENYGGNYSTETLKIMIKTGKHQPLVSSSLKREGVCMNHFNAHCCATIMAIIKSRERQSTCRHFLLS